MTQCSGDGGVGTADFIGGVAAMLPGPNKMVDPTALRESFSNTT